MIQKMQKNKYNVGKHHIIFISAQEGCRPLFNSLIRRTSILTDTPVQNIYDICL